MSTYGKVDGGTRLRVLLAYGENPELDYCSAGLHAVLPDCGNIYSSTSPEVLTADQ